MDALYHTYEATVRIGDRQYKTRSTYPTHSLISQEWIEHNIKEGFVRWLVKELDIQIEQVDY
jgi:hypothetical protein